MKLAFSTLGCPDFEWSDIYSLAKDFGFQGIEMRGLGDDMFSVYAKPFREDNLPKTIELLKKLKLKFHACHRAVHFSMRINRSKP
jgi:fatty-acyl-CoA synthase